MPKRKTPSQHKVRTHSRKGRFVKSYTRGKGQTPSRVIVSRKIVSSDLNLLSRDLEPQEWLIDTEYCHGEKGLISLGPSNRTGRAMKIHGPGIGSDLSVMGSLDEILDDLRNRKGEVYRYLKRNNYSTKLTDVELSDDSSTKDKRYLNAFGKKYNIKT